MPAGELRTSALTRAILTKRLNLRGFIVSDFAARQNDFLRDVSAWLRDGRIKYREDVVDGIEKAPRAGVVYQDIGLCGFGRRPACDYAPGSSF
jgi:NADPH-dependent curcumin reductase CurA